MLVTTRLAQTHYDFAAACIKQGRPVFVDKPFLPEPESARRLIELAAQHNVPLVAGSTFCFLPEIPHWKSLLAVAQSVLLRYWADPDSPFGGYSFYGSHLTDLSSLLFDGALRVSSRRTGEMVTSIVEYEKRQVILQTASTHNAVECVYEAGGSLCLMRLNDRACYVRGMDAFWKAIKEHQSMPNIQRLVESTRLLGAINRSLVSGRTEIV